MRAPAAQIPKQTKISTVDGVYSTIEPKGDGTNPGMISPIPFSIQIPIIAKKHVKRSKFSLSLNLGMRKKHEENVPKKIAVQI